MVTATAGTLITCDIPTRQYLVWLNKQRILQNSKGAFIIRELDDTHLLIKDDFVDFVIRQVKDFNNKNVYTPPVEQQ